MKISKLSLICLLLLNGCASLTGSAFYTYEKVGNDCTVKIDSGRVLKAGAVLEISSCDIKVSANSLEQGGSSVQDLNQLIQALGSILTTGRVNDTTGSNQPTPTETGR